MSDTNRWIREREHILFRTICGSRVRVEFSHGRGRSSRGGGGGGGGGGSSGGGRSRRRSGSRSPRSRKPFSAQDVCYECGGQFLLKANKQTLFSMSSLNSRSGTLCL